MNPLNPTPFLESLEQHSGTWKSESDSSYQNNPNTHSNDVHISKKLQFMSTKSREISDFLQQCAPAKSHGTTLFVKFRAPAGGRRQALLEVSESWGSGRGGGDLTKFNTLIREGSAPRSNPLPFYTPFWQKRCPFYKSFIEKRFLFHTTTLFLVYCLINKLTQP